MKNKSIFEQLRERRNQLARDARIKPFMILHNSVLKEIAEKSPKTLAELKKIKGMGVKRIDRYGGIILEILNGSQQEKIFSVSEYLDFLNTILTPQVAIIQGEVSSIDIRESYIFFTLQDKLDEAVLKCFIWRNKLENLGVELRDGIELKVQGYPAIYKRYGRFTFEVEHVGLIGEGALKVAFEILKKKLTAEGYFAPDRKKKLPEYVQTIGLITSSEGDAIKDFVAHLGHFGFRVYFYNIHVEGLHAVDDVISAIRWFNENMLDIDVLVLIRGGGGLESLQAFNTASIAKAIFGSKVPIITGIGHENDDTIADMVADFRASTPTAAARVLSDPWRNTQHTLKSSEENIISIFKLSWRSTYKNIDGYESFFFAEMERQIQNQKIKIDYLQKDLKHAVGLIMNDLKSKEEAFYNNWQRLKNKISSIKISFNYHERLLIRDSEVSVKVLERHLTQMEEKLSLSNPALRLGQGYSITFDSNNKVVKSSRQLQIGDRLKIKLHEGGALSSVEKIQS